jgi:hypothetical protein
VNVKRIALLLLVAILAFAAGTATCLAQIGWTVLAANGVRDIALISMQEQGEALRVCRQAAPPPPKPTIFRPLPKRLEL